MTDYVRIVANANYYETYFEGGCSKRASSRINPDIVIQSL